VAVKLSHRQRQASATREAIARTALQLFADRGYVATTIQAISEAADIPAPTIYSALGSKPAVLEEIRRLWIAEASVEELYAQALTKSEPAERLRLAAKWTRRQMELGHGVITVYQEAARADPRARDLWRDALAGREAAVRKLLTSMQECLRPGLDVKQAMDLYVVATLPEVFRSLVLERDWSLDEYEAWLAERLEAEILGGLTHAAGAPNPEEC
jgi:AcrR family transcriptional regulator